ncbi:MAG: NHL repeat-containing protein [Candidatus Zixiibacteriota bacterium]|nr:MAG: NHL repeat-containing protein [candidate division Zixibacteria bacterium]
MLLTAILIGGCGTARREPVAAEISPRRPVAVVIDTVISGSVLGHALREPVGLAADRQGVLYVTDAGNQRILQFSSDLKPMREIGGYGSEPGQFDRPGYLALDNSLALVVVDGGNRRLARYDSRLNFFAEIRLEDDEDLLKYGYPSGVAVTDYGEVWVADRQNNRIALFDNQARFERFVGDFGYTGGQLRGPEKILRDGRGGFIVCDAGNSRLVAYDEYGNFSRELKSADFDYPAAAAVDHLGWLWIVDGSSNRLDCLSLQSEPILAVGQRLPGADGSLRSPSDVVVMDGNRIVISDTGNNRLLVGRIIYGES